MLRLLLAGDGGQVGHVRDGHGRPPVDARRWIDGVAQLVLPLHRLPVCAQTLSTHESFDGKEKNICIQQK